MSTGTITRPRAGDPASIDPRLAARRVEVARARGRRRLRRLVAVLGVVALALGAFGLARSPLLDVDRIVVSGAASSGADAVAEAAGIPVGRSMASVDPARAEARIEALPWVADARVSRSWPGTVRVEVTERVAIALAGSGPEAVLVDREARLLGPAPAGSALPRIAPTPGGAPGEVLSGDRRAAVALVADLPEPLLAEVASATVDAGDHSLVLGDGIEVRLGDRTRLRAKSDAVMGLLEQADRPTIASIDVSVPSAAALTRQDAEGA